MRECAVDLIFMHTFEAVIALRVCCDLPLSNEGMYVCMFVCCYVCFCVCWQAMFELFRFGFMLCFCLGVGEVCVCKLNRCVKFGFCKPKNWAGFF